MGAGGHALFLLTGRTEYLRSWKLRAVLLHHHFIGGINSKKIRDFILCGSVLVRDRFSDWRYPSSSVNIPKRPLHYDVGSALNVSQTSCFTPPPPSAVCCKCCKVLNEAQQFVASAAASENPPKNEELPLQLHGEWGLECFHGAADTKATFPQMLSCPGFRLFLNH